MKRLFACLFAGLVLPASAAAQNQIDYFGDVAAQLRPGEQAVIWTVAGEIVRGRFLEANDETIRLRREAGDIELASRDVQRVERAGDRIWDGAGIGGAVGFAAGAILMATCEPGFMCDNSWDAVLACGGMAAAFGFGVGALGDWLIRPERLVFERGAPRPRVSVSAALSRKGGAIRVRVAF
jgi:hypothetical protein